MKFFHKPWQRNDFHIITHRKLIVTTVKDVFMRCAKIITGLAIVLAEFGGNAMLDLYGPDFRRWHLDNQIDLCTGGCSVKPGFCAIRQDWKNIFNSKTFPTLTQNRIRQQIVVAVDTSGSIDQEEIQEFISEIDAIKSQVRASVTLLTCDSKLNYGCPWIFEAWDQFQFDVEIRGGGGTNFKPVFDWIYEQDKAPDLLVYFTDAEGVFPEAEPYFPVTWLVKGKSKVPFGVRVQLNWCLYWKTIFLPQRHRVHRDL